MIKGINVVLGDDYLVVIISLKRWKLKKERKKEKCMKSSSGTRNEILSLDSRLTICWLFFFLSTIWWWTI